MTPPPSVNIPITSIKTQRKKVPKKIGARKPFPVAAEWKSPAIEQTAPIAASAQRMKPTIKKALTLTSLLFSIVKLVVGQTVSDPDIFTEHLHNDSSDLLFSHSWDSISLLHKDAPPYFKLPTHNHFDLHK